MTRADFLKEMAGILMVAPEALQPQMELRTIKTWDSTAVVGLIVLLDDQGVSVDTQLVPECKTVQDVLDLAGDNLQ